MVTRVFHADLVLGVWVQEDSARSGFCGNGYESLGSPRELVGYAVASSPRELLFGVLVRESSTQTSFVSLGTRYNDRILHAFQMGKCKHFHGPLLYPEPKYPHADDSCT